MNFSDGFVMKRRGIPRLENRETWGTRLLANHYFDIAIQRIEEMHGALRENPSKR